MNSALPESLLSRREFLSATVAGMATGIVGCAARTPAIRADMPFDTIIKNGTVIDGSGSDGIRADVGLKNGVITAIGDLQSAQATRIIDATGLTVVPGFIDIHSHVDKELFTYPKAESKVRQGVTTEVTGMDGESEGPLGGPELERKLSVFKEDYGFECPYRDIAGFLQLLEQKRMAQNILTYVGLGSVREVVVGLDNRPATDDEIKEMQRVVVSAIEQGAWGVSTGLEYTPGSFASAEELARVISAVPEPYRVYATHMRNEDDRVLEAIEEAITIARTSGARLQISHLKAQNKSNWDKQKRALGVARECYCLGDGCSRRSLSVCCVQHRLECIVSLVVSRWRHRAISCAFRRCLAVAADPRRGSEEDPRFGIVGCCDDLVGGAR